MNSATDDGGRSGPEVGVGPHPEPWPTDPRYDPQLLAEGDRRNVVDGYRYWTLEAIKADLDLRRHPFHVVIENWQHDLNIGTVVRTANAFLAAEVHIVGRRRWNRRGAMVTDRYQHIRHHPKPEDLAEWAIEDDLPLIGIDNLPGSVALGATPLPRRCALVFGQEGPGLSEPIRDLLAECRSIPQFGSTRSINAGVAAGIAMHNWIQQHVRPAATLKIAASSSARRRLCANHPTTREHPPQHLLDRNRPGQRDGKEQDSSHDLPNDRRHRSYRLGQELVGEGLDGHDRIQLGATSGESPQAGRLELVDDVGFQAPIGRKDEGGIDVARLEHTASEGSRVGLGIVRGHHNKVEPSRTSLPDRLRDRLFIEFVASRGLVDAIDRHGFGDLQRRFGDGRRRDETHRGQHEHEPERNDDDRFPNRRVSREGTSSS